MGGYRNVLRFTHTKPFILRYLFFLFWSVTLYNSLLTAQILPEWYIVVNRSPSSFEEIYRVPTFLLIDLLITLLYLYHFYPTFQSTDCFNTGAAEANLRGYPLPQAPGWGAKIGLYSFTLQHLRRSPIQVLTGLNVA